MKRGEFKGEEISHHVFRHQPRFEPLDIILSICSIHTACLTNNPAQPAVQECLDAKYKMEQKHSSPTPLSSRNLVTTHPSPTKTPGPGP